MYRKVRQYKFYYKNSILAYATCTSDIAQLTTLHRRREANSIQDRQPPPMKTHLKLTKCHNAPGSEPRRMRAVQQSARKGRPWPHLTRRVQRNPQARQGRGRTNCESRRAQATQHELQQARRLPRRITTLSPRDIAL